MILDLDVVLSMRPDILLTPSYVHFLKFKGFKELPPTLARCEVIYVAPR
jgi:hypothetical protein